MTPTFYHGKVLAYVLFCCFFATAAHQRLILMFLVRTKFAKNSVKVSNFPRSIHEEIKKRNGYLNYSKGGVNAKQYEQMIMNQNQPLY